MKSKAILILDKMPESCEKCELYGNYVTGIPRCSITYIPIISNAKQDCPLKPLPNQISHSEINDPFDENYECEYAYWEIEGYNQCLKEILGEEKE